MSRRDTLKLLFALGAAAGSLGLNAQVRPGNRPFKIAMTWQFPTAEVRAINVGEMSKLGWREHQDFVLLEAGAQMDTNKPEENVRRALAQKPDVLLVLNTAYAVEAHRQTRTIPIVMFSSGYPVEAGVAHSLARPGKNVTGNALYAGIGIWGKFLQLLRDCKPGIKRVGVLWSYVPPAFPADEIEPGYRELRDSAAKLGMAVKIVEVATRLQVPESLDAIAAWKPDAMLVTAGLMPFDDWTRVMQFAIDRKLPTISDWQQTADDKRHRPLIVYAPGLASLRTQTYAAVDKILRGASPGDLPIQQPAKFDLVIDRKMANAINLKLPQALLIRADRVNE